MVMPPHSQIGPITPEQRAVIIKSSVVAGVYETVVDRESAYERLKGKVVASGVGGAPGGGTPAAAGGVAGGAAAGSGSGGGWSRRVRRWVGCWVRVVRGAGTRCCRLR